jgi:hypothetical protein
MRQHTDCRNSGFQGRLYFEAVAIIGGILPIGATFK